MIKAYTRVPDPLADPLFEVFDGGDFVLSSWRDVEKPGTEVQVYFPEAERAGEAKAKLRAALDTVGCDAPVEVCEVPDEDWKYSYRRHFTTQLIGDRLAVVPAWEADSTPTPGRERIVIDPGLAFGTGKHETTRSCLLFIDKMARDEALRGECSGAPSFLDMGCGSGILSIAAAKLGFAGVKGFDNDPDAVEAARENAHENGASVEYSHYALGGGGARPEPADAAAANILGPVLAEHAAEITSLARRRLAISGILSEIYDGVLAAFRGLGWRELERIADGEWTSGLLTRDA